MHDPGDEQPTESAEEPPYKRLVNRLRCVVNPTSMRYHGAPVYLVGGALRDEDPRDVDIVVVVPDQLFYYAYLAPDHSIDWMHKHWRYEGNTAFPERAWCRWARDCTKQARWLTIAAGCIVDFKVQFETEAAAYDGPRVLLSMPYAVPRVS